MRVGLYRRCYSEPAFRYFFLSDLFLNTSYLQAFEKSPSNPKAFMSPHRAAFFHRSPPARSLETLLGWAFCSSKGRSPDPSRAQGTARTDRQTDSSGSRVLRHQELLLEQTLQTPWLTRWGLLYFPPASRGEGPASSIHGGAEWESGWRLKSLTDPDPRQTSTSNRATWGRGV